MRVSFLVCPLRQVRAWQVFRLPPLERAVAVFVREVCQPASSRSKKAASAESTLKKLTEVIEHLQYVVTEGCFDELRDMVRMYACMHVRTARRGVIGGGAPANTVARSRIFGVVSPPPLFVFVPTPEPSVIFSIVGHMTS